MSGVVLTRLGDVFGSSSISSSSLWSANDLMWGNDSNKNEGEKNNEKKSPSSKAIHTRAPENRLISIVPEQIKSCNNREIIANSIISNSTYCTSHDLDLHQSTVTNNTTLGIDQSKLSFDTIEPNEFQEKQACSTENCINDNNIGLKKTGSLKKNEVDAFPRERFWDNRSSTGLTRSSDPDTIQTKTQNWEGRWKKEVHIDFDEVEDDYLIRHSSLESFPTMSPASELVNETDLLTHELEEIASAEDALLEQACCVSPVETEPHTVINMNPVPILSPKVKLDKRPMANESESTTCNHSSISLPMPLSSMYWNLGTQKEQYLLICEQQQQQRQFQIQQQLQQKNEQQQLLLIQQQQLLQLQQKELQQHQQKEKEQKREQGLQEIQKIQKLQEQKSKEMCADQKSENYFTDLNDQYPTFYEKSNMYESKWNYENRSEIEKGVLPHSQSWESSCSSYLGPLSSNLKIQQLIQLEKPPKQKHQPPQLQATGSTQTQMQPNKFFKHKRSSFPKNRLQQQIGAISRSSLRQSSDKLHISKTDTGQSQAVSENVKTNRKNMSFETNELPETNIESNVFVLNIDKGLGLEDILRRKFVDSRKIIQYKSKKCKRRVLLSVIDPQYLLTDENMVAECAQGFITFHDCVELRTLKTREIMTRNQRNNLRKRLASTANIKVQVDVSQLLHDFKEPDCFPRAAHHHIKLNAYLLTPAIEQVLLCTREKDLAEDGSTLSIEDQMVFELAKQPTSAKALEEFLDNHRDTDLQRSDFKGLCPIHYAAKTGGTEVIQTLIKNGADVNQKDKSDQTALHYAIYNGHKSVQFQLLKEGAKVNTCNISGNNLLHVSAYHNQLSVAKVIIEEAPELLYVSNHKFKSTPLDCARYKKLDEMSKLLSSGMLKAKNRGLN